MKRLSVLASLFGAAWHVRPRLLITYLLLLAADVVATGLFGLALRSLISASLHADAPGAVLAASIAAVCWTATAAGTSARTNMAYLLAESVSVELDQRVLRLLGHSAGLEHLETPEYVDRLALLRGGGDLMAHYALGLLDAVANILRLTVILALLAVVQPALLLLALLLSAVLLIKHLGLKRVARSMLTTAEDARLVEHLFSLHTDPAAAMEIRISGARKNLEDRASEVWNRVVRRQENARWSAAAAGIGGWGLFMAGYGVALLAIARAIASGRAEPGDVLLVLTLTVSLRNEAEDTVWTLHGVAEGRHYLDAYLAVHADTVDLPPLNPAAAPERLTEGIAFHDVSFTYPGTKTPVLNDIDLELPAGSTVAIVGEHGAGKTTLVKLLCALYAPTSGVITVDRVPLADIPGEEWRGRGTASFQDFAKFAWLVRESIGCGDLLHVDDVDRIGQAVALGDATEVVDLLPDGLDTQLGLLFGGYELSEGQWQRIALSRAFMRTAPVLFVLDEPTASLDARSEYLVYQRQVAYARKLADVTGAVTVVISHRFSTVRMADKIIVLSGGTITESGSHDELMAAGGSYAQLYALQASGYQSGAVLDLTGSEGI